jgi:hypothetical protein
VARFGSDDRDRGLRRVSSITKWLVAGSVAAVGVVTGVVAAAAPGSSRSTTPSDTSNPSSGNPNSGSGVTGSTPTTTQPRVVDPGTDITPSAPDDNGFVPPTDPPVRIHRRPVTNSGGS